MGIKAYTRTLRDTEEPRQIERRVLSRATAALEAYQANHDGADKSERVRLLASGLKEALWSNQQVWMALKADLSLPGNSLPPETRAGLLSLALFVARQTQGVLGGTGAIGPLIQVNRSIIDGLGARPRPMLAAEGA